METLSDATSDYMQRRRVRAGIALFDDKLNYDWRERIDPDRLDVSSPGNCVLGMVFGDYATGQAVLGIIEPADFGFDTDPCETYRGLTLTWLEELELERELVAR